MQVEKLVRDINKLTKEQQLAIVKNDSPEIFGFIDDMKLHIKTLKIITPTRQFLVQEQDSITIHPDILQYLELKEQLLLTYLYNMEYYFHIKSLGQNNVINHPVMKQLLELRYAIKHMKKNDHVFQGALDAIIRLRGCSKKDIKELVGHPKFNKYLMRGLLANEVGSDEESDDSEDMEDEESQDDAPNEYIDDDSNDDEEEDADYNDYLDEDEERFSAKPKASSKKNQRHDALDDVGEYEDMDIFAHSNGGSDANMKELQKTLLKLTNAKGNSKSAGRSAIVGDDTLAPLPGNGRNAIKAPVQDSDDEEDEEDDGRGAGDDDDGNSSDDYDKFEARIDENEGFLNDYDDDDDYNDNPVGDSDNEDDVAPRKRRRAPEAGNDDDIEEEEENLLELFSKKKKKFNEMKKQHYSVAPRYGGAQEQALDGDKKRAASYEIMKNRGLTPHRKKSNRNPRVKKREMYNKAIIARKGQVRDVVTGVGSAYPGELTGIKANIARSRKIHN